MPKQQVDEQAILRQAIDDLDPQVPIRLYLIDGDLITLRLADGRKILYNWREQRTITEDDGRTSIPAGDLSAHLKADLLDIAQTVDLPGRSSMTKAELVQALEELRDG